MTRACSVVTVTATLTQLEFETFRKCFFLQRETAFDCGLQVVQTYTEEEMGKEDCNR